jgi:hypothetical protein
MFARVPDEEIRAQLVGLLERIVTEWEWDIPLTIVEANHVDELLVMTSK